MIHVVATIEILQGHRDEFLDQLNKVVPLVIGKAEIANRTHPDKGSKIRHFNGRIGELLIFNDALSASEIAELHQNGNKYD